MSDLKLCPFCGSYAEDVMRTGAVVCVNCDASAKGAREWNARANADQLTALQAENARLREENEAMKSAVDDGLSARMVAAGMVPLDATTKPDCLTRFHVHAGMTDFQFFGEWLERKAREYIRMQAAHQTGDRVMNDDIADFVIGKAGAFKEALENFRAALKQET